MLIRDLRSGALGTLAASIILRAGSVTGPQINHIEYFDVDRAVAAVLCAVADLGDVRLGVLRSYIGTIRELAAVYVCPDQYTGVCYEMTGHVRQGGTVAVQYSPTPAGMVNDLVRLDLWREVAG